MLPRLLITDDSLVIREMLKEIALEAGWEIAGEAADGEEAILQYSALRPDAVTLDLVMPIHDGMHALRGIRAVDAGALAIVISAISQSDVLKEAIRLGAADFIVKPFRRAHALAALKWLAERAGAKHETLVSGGAGV